MVKQQARPLIASPPWTPEEEQLVREGAIAVSHPAAIGAALGRTEQAVRHRMNLRGIPTKRRLKRRAAKLAQSGIIG